MDADYGIARELSDLQKLRSHYHPELPPCLQVQLCSIHPLLTTTTSLYMPNSLLDLTCYITLFSILVPLFSSYHV